MRKLLISWLYNSLSNDGKMQVLAKIVFKSLLKASQDWESEMFQKVERKVKKPKKVKKEKKMKPMKYFESSSTYNPYPDRIFAGRASSRGTTQALLDLAVGQKKVFGQSISNIAPIASGVGNKYKRQYSGQTIWPNSCEYKRLW